MSGSCRNPKSDPLALANMIRYAFDKPPKMTKEKLKRMYRKITGQELSDKDAQHALDKR